MKKAIFAGSFDPIHEGHIKIIKKASKLFDHLFVVVANNDAKASQSDINKRKTFVESKISISNVSVVSIENKYVATYAKENDIKYLVRSARNSIDFSYELDMAKVNKDINNELETILVIPDYDDIKFSSSKFRDFKIEGNK